MFVADTAGSLDGSPVTESARRAPRPTSPPASPGSGTAPDGSAGSATTRSAGSSSPSCRRRHRHPTVTLDSDAPTGFQLKTAADGGDPEVVYFRRNSAGSRLAPWPAHGRLHRRRPAPARHRYPAGSVGQRPGLRVPRRGRGPRGGRHGLLRHQPAARCCGPARRRWCGWSTRWPRAPTGCCPGSREGHLLPGRPDADGVGRVLPGAGRILRRDQERRRTAPARHTAEGCTGSPSSRCEVVDTVGAGDGFAAGLHQRDLDGAGPARGACAGRPPSARWPPPAPATGTACPPGRSWTRSSRPWRSRWRDDGAADRPGPDPARAGPRRHPVRAPLADWIEVGTSLVKRYGVTGSRRWSTPPAATPVLADLKTADDAAHRVRPGLRRRGRLGRRCSGSRPTSPWTSPSGSRTSGGREVMVDLMELPPARRAVLAARLPAHVVLAAHVGKDAQARACAAVDLLGPWADGRRLALAGGLTAADLPALADLPDVRRDRRVGRDRGRRPRRPPCGTARRGPPGQGAHVDDLIDPDPCCRR